MTIWPRTEVGDNQDAKREVMQFNATNVFSTPKPERLMERILHLATNPGDLVLDSFAGSGTTGAVAQKMGRKWIMVELGEHCHTHIVPRLAKVIDGTDQGGVSKAVGWKGGGGFRYYNLAPSLLETDKWGHLVINKAYNPAMLAEAMCKLHGFEYAPNPDIFWQQGHSTETDFLYVTTQTLTHNQLEWINDEVGPDRTLLICCAAYTTPPDAYASLTLQKIPDSVRARCEWARDDYSLNVRSLPDAPRRPGPEPTLDFAT
jgi:adenine-specific DNA-methyltransferase